MAENAPAPWALEAANGLIKSHFDADHKVRNMETFRAALAKALDDTYEEGLEAGLVTGAGS